MTKFNPKVSIIIPVYNGSNYLEEAIDSALAQTYKNIEILVINDGSNDNGETEKIALSYGKQVKYYKKENGGVSTALNLGIEKMTGEYFSWLSHDDIYLPVKVEEQVEFLRTQNEKKVVLYCDYDLIDENGKKTRSPLIFNHEDLIRYPYKSLWHGCLNGITMLIPKEAFEKCGNFDVSLRCTQDYDMWMRLIEKYKFIHMNKLLTLTRLHSNQDSNISPNVISECNVLWKKIINSADDSRIKEYYGNKLDFYYAMYNFLKNTPYSLASKYCFSEIDRIKREKYSELKNKQISVILLLDSNVKGLDRAIQSINKQTYKNIFVIVIAKDKIQIKESDELLKKLQFKYKVYEKVKFQTKYIKDEYVTFLSTDCTLNKFKIEKQLLALVCSDKSVSITSHTLNSKVTKIINMENVYFQNGIYDLSKSINISAIMYKNEPTISLELSSNNIDNLINYINFISDEKLLIMPDNLFEIKYRNQNYDTIYLEKLKHILVYIIEKQLYEKNSILIKDVCGDYYFTSSTFNGLPTPADRVRAIENSRLWKLTAPCRFFIRALRKIYRISKNIVRKVFK